MWASAFMVKIFLGFCKGWEIRGEWSWKHHSLIAHSFFFLEPRNDEVEVAVKLCDKEGVLTLGKLGKKYIDDPDLRAILANAELDANKMEAFAESYQLRLITSVIYSEKETECIR